jgi:4-aminobutyrate aminotransferase-like enzyme
MMGQGGIYGNVIRVAHPVTIKQEECERAIVVLDGVLTEL